MRPFYGCSRLSSRRLSADGRAGKRHLWALPSHAGSAAEAGGVRGWTRCGICWRGQEQGDLLIDLPRVAVHFLLQGRDALLPPDRPRDGHVCLGRFYESVNGGPSFPDVREHSHENPFDV